MMLSAELLLILSAGVMFLLLAWATTTTSILYLLSAGLIMFLVLSVVSTTTVTTLSRMLSAGLTLLLVLSVVSGVSYNNDWAAEIPGGIEKARDTIVIQLNKCSDRSMEVNLPYLLGNHDRPTDEGRTNQLTNRRTRGIHLPF